MCSASAAEDCWAMAQGEARASPIRKSNELPASPIILRRDLVVIGAILFCMLVCTNILNKIKTKKNDRCADEDLTLRSLATIAQTANL